MSEKSVEDVVVEVDEVSLSLLGWEMDRIAARLVTKPDYGGGYTQELVVSGMARFTPEDWSDRFNDGDYAPTLMLCLSRTGAAFPVNYEELVMDTVKKVSKRPQRFSAESHSWETDEPVGAGDITLSVTAFDLEEVQPEFTIPPDKVLPVSLDVVDESSTGPMELKVATAGAYFYKGSFDIEFRLHLSGFLEFSSAEELLAHYLESEEWLDQNSRLDEVSPFEVRTPGLVVEIMDDTGFLLEQREIDFWSHVPVDDLGRVPRRQPRWLLDIQGTLDDFSGRPEQVVVRITDAEDL